MRRVTIPKHQITLRNEVSIMIAKFLSCGGIGCSFTQMVSGLLHSQGNLPDGLQFSNHDVIFTHQGRYAIYLICQLWKIGLGDEVIVPAYNCGAEIDPFIWAGATVVFYRVDNRAALDIEDIIRRVTPATKLIYVTHFFGWPQEINELGKWCKEKGLYLVEDCAHSLYSKGPNNTIGRIGDAAIYSFAKTLPVPDGGALVIKKNSWNENMMFRSPRFSNIFYNSLPLLKKWFMHNMKYWQHSEYARKLLVKSWLKKPINQRCEIWPEMPKSNYFDEQKIYWSISRLSKGMICASIPKKIIEIRRNNYNYLYNSLFNIPSIKPLFGNLPNGVCPLSFPMFVKDRSRWCKNLEDRGILVGGWPSYHRGFDWEGFPEAVNLKNNLLTLPIHQNLEIHHMEHIAACVKVTANETG